jgi:transposase
MHTVVERCCGLDIHQASVVACILIQEGRTVRKEIRTFSTMTRDLETLRDWLVAQGVTHVAMESTGVYWKPVHAILYGSFELIVANAHHIRHVPGRKTDVKDAEWIAELVRHGLITASFVPPPAIAELRDLTRYRRKVVESQATERNRTLKLLESANIKLSAVATDVFGVSGMAMLKALITGDATPTDMANFAKGRLRRKLEPLAQALDGRLTETHRFLLKLQVNRLEEMERDIIALDQIIAEKAKPYSQQIGLLIQIPGVDRQIALVIIADPKGSASKMGVDLSHWPTAQKLAAWAGICPGNHESAGKARSGQTRKGNLYLKSALFLAGTTAARTRGSYLKDKYHRLKARRGAKRAAMAIAHKILIAAYHMLTEGTDYIELGEAYLDKLAEKRITRGLVRRLTNLGYKVTLEQQAA